MDDDSKLKSQFTSKVRDYGFWRSVSFLGERAVIRSLRIALGGGVYLFAKGILGEARGILDQRFADLSPISLGQGVILAAVGIGIVFLALYIAFGPGKSLAAEKRKWSDAKELEEYCQTILKSIRRNWSPPKNARMPSHVTLDAYKGQNGELRKIDTRGLNNNSELKQSLEAAIRETLPAPRLHFNSRRKNHIQITFYPADDDERYTEVRSW